MRGTRVDKCADEIGISDEKERDKERVGIGKSGRVESNKCSYARKVNATLSLVSFFLRVADYFFESAESDLDSEVVVAARAFADLDLLQSRDMCPFSPQ
jgi:hypothetical protein